MNPRNAPLVLFLALATACASSRDRERAEIAELGADHDRRQAEFAAEQERFLSANPTPWQRESPGLGTLVVHEAAIGGRLGQETLHLLFTWVNTTPIRTNGAAVHVRLLDPTGQVVKQQRVPLRSLLGAGFLTDSSYTSFVDLPTEGVHLKPGWDWRIELEPLIPVLSPPTEPAQR